MLHLYDRPRKEIPYDCIDVVYANNTAELAAILRMYSSKGYQYIRLTPSEPVENQVDEYPSSADSRLVIGQEFDKVVVVMDSMFSYDANGELTAKIQTEPDYLFQRLFYQNITRVRKKLCIVVLNNPELIECLLGIKNYSMDFKRTAERKPVKD